MYRSDLAKDERVTRFSSARTKTFRDPTTRSLRLLPLPRLCKSRWRPARRGLTGVSGLIVAVGKVKVVMDTVRRLSSILIRHTPAWKRDGYSVNAEAINQYRSTMPRRMPNVPLRSPWRETSLSDDDTWKRSLSHGNNFLQTDRHVIETSASNARAHTHLAHWCIGTRTRAHTRGFGECINA